jgi:ATP-binding cassette, subfamily A (ABC1), member 3
MIGNPPIVFLDEPSTDMDPEARRFMCDVISRISAEIKRSFIILTTQTIRRS